MKRNLKHRGHCVGLIFFILSWTLLIAGTITVARAATMPSHEWLYSITSMISAPTAVAVDNSGRIYVTESSMNNLHIYSQSGQHLNTLTGLAKPISAAADNSGRIFIGNKVTGNVEVYDRNVTFLFKLGIGDGEFSQPNSIAVDSSGNIYVADYLQDEIKVYHPDGSYNYSYGTSGSGKGQFNYPVSIAINESANEIIILDRQLTPTLLKGARIQVFDMTSWLFKRSFGNYGSLEGEMNKPQGVAVDTAGRIYVTEFMYHVVYVYDWDGTYLGKLNDSMSPITTPLGIAMSDSSRLYVALLNTGAVEVYGIVPYTNMAVVPLSLSFQGQQSGSNPPLQSIEISNNGTDILDWTASTNDSWITLSDTSGSIGISGTYTVNIGADLTGLTAGTYSGRVSISAASGATEIVNVSLTVTESGSALVADAGGPYNGIEGQAVLLDGSNSTGNITMYEWDVDGDGTYDAGSSSSTYSYIYNQNGTYTINLRVTDNLNATDVASTTVEIADTSPTTDFTGSPTHGAAPLAVNFTNYSSGHDQPLTYEWDFDNNGTIDSTDQNPSHVYPNGGTYSVTLTVFDSDGSTNSLTRQDYVNVSSGGSMLTTYLNGTGNGSVESYPPGIDCGTDCQETYTSGQIVTLTALPDAGSTFTGWTGGGCTGTGDCDITMNAGTDVTASFDACPNLPARINSAVPVYYTTLQAAYDQASDGDIIQSHVARFRENLTIDLNTAITIQGGYSCDYSTTKGMTIVKGTVTMNSGTAVLEDITVE